MKNRIIRFVCMMLFGNGFFSFLMFMGPYSPSFSSYLFVNCIIIILWCILEMGEAEL